ITASSTNESAIDSLLLRMPSLLVTRTVSGLEATVMRISSSQERIPMSVKRARSTVVITADKSKTTLTTEIPVMRAVLLQLVFIAGAQSFRLDRRFSNDFGGLGFARLIWCQHCLAQG